MKEVAQRGEGFGKWKDLIDRRECKQDEGFESSRIEGQVGRPSKTEGRKCLNTHNKGDCTYLSTRRAVALELPSKSND